MRSLTIIVLFVLAACCGILYQAQAAVQKDPRAFFEETCSQCHAIDIPKGEKLSRADWEYTVSRMRSNGLSISDEEARIIIDYLAATYTVTR